MSAVVPAMWQKIALAAILLGFSAWLLWWRARQLGREAPVTTDRIHPAIFTRGFDVDGAVAYAGRRLTAIPPIDTSTLRRILAWTSHYVHAHARPMNGGGPDDGWYMPPNHWEVVQYLCEKCEDAGLGLEDEALWEIVALHEDYLRSLPAE